MNISFDYYVCNNNMKLTLPGFEVKIIAIAKIFQDSLNYLRENNNYYIFKIPQ